MLSTETLGPELVKIMGTCPRCGKGSKLVEVEESYRSELEARKMTIFKFCASCERTLSREMTI